MPREEALRLQWYDEPAKGEGDADEAGTLAFARLLIAGTLENVDEIDAILTRHLKNWDLRRIGKVDLAVLRLGAYGILYLKDIPASVTIDEAVEIVKEFGSDESYRFVNGVLDGIRKSEEN